MFFGNKTPCSQKSRVFIIIDVAVVDGMGESARGAGRSRDSADRSGPSAVSQAVTGSYLWLPRRLLHSIIRAIGMLDTIASRERHTRPLYTPARYIRPRHIGIFNTLIVRPIKLIRRHANVIYVGNVVRYPPVSIYFKLFIYMWVRYYQSAADESFQNTHGWEYLPTLYISKYVISRQRTLFLFILPIFCCNTSRVR